MSQVARIQTTPQLGLAALRQDLRSQAQVAVITLIAVPVLAWTAIACWHLGCGGLPALARRFKLRLGDAECGKNVARLERDRMRKQLSAAQDSLTAYPRFSQVLEQLAWAKRHLSAIRKEHNALRQELRERQERVAQLLRRVQELKRQTQDAHQNAQAAQKAKQQQEKAALVEPLKERIERAKQRVQRLRAEANELPKQTQQRNEELGKFAKIRQEVETIHGRLESGHYAGRKRPSRAHLRAILQHIRPNGPKVLATLIPRLRQQLRLAGVAVELRIRLRSRITLNQTHLQHRASVITEPPGNPDLTQLVQWWQELKNTRPELLENLIAARAPRHKRIEELDRNLPKLVSGTDQRLQQAHYRELSRKVLGHFVVQYSARLHDPSDQTAWSDLAEALFLCVGDVAEGGCKDRVSAMYRELFFRRLDSTGARHATSAVTQVLDALLRLRAKLFLTCVEQQVATWWIVGQDPISNRQVRQRADHSTGMRTLIHRALSDRDLAERLGLSRADILDFDAGFAERGAIPGQALQLLIQQMQSAYTPQRIIEEFYETQPFEFEEAARELLKGYGLASRLYTLPDRTMLSLFDAQLFYDDGRRAALSWDGLEDSWPAIEAQLSAEDLDTVQPYRFNYRGLALLLQDIAFEPFV